VGGGGGCVHFTTSSEIVAFLLYTMFQLLGTAVLILLYLCTCSTKFYINNVFPYISGLPEVGLCRPKYVGEITATH